MSAVELDKLRHLPLGENAFLSELPAFISSFKLGQEQADQIHKEPVPMGIILWVGGVRGGRVQFNDGIVSTTVLDYAQMIISKGVLFEDCIEQNRIIQATDLAASNGRLVKVEFRPQILDIKCVQAQLLGLINRFDPTKDDYRVVGIIGDAVRFPVLSHKRRREIERRKYERMLQRLNK